MHQEPIHQIIDDPILFMKVGFHGTEELDQIIDRKSREAIAVGATYWGYGGSLCHPRSVQTLAKLQASQGRSISVAFAVTKSPFHHDDPSRATHFSTDGVRWNTMHQAAAVTASKYALVLADLKPVTAVMDLNSYEVAIGPSEGKCLGEYIRFRVDKAMARRRGYISPASRVEMQIAFTARLVEPYAIWVRR